MKGFITETIMAIILTTIISTGLLILISFSCNLDKRDRASENVTKDNSITEKIDTNVSCTAFASHLVKQQLAKKSDQNLAESTINVCNTQMMNSDCMQWEKYGYKDAAACRAFHQTRK